MRRETRQKSSSNHRRIFTTLYDLIAAVSEAAGPGEDALVAATVSSLLDSGRAVLLDQAELAAA
jgi:hypothetical protein